MDWNSLHNKQSVYYYKIFLNLVVEIVERKTLVPVGMRIFFPLLQRGWKRTILTWAPPGGEAGDRRDPRWLQRSELVPLHGLSGQWPLLQPTGATQSPPHGQTELPGEEPWLPPRRRPGKESQKT